MSKFSDEMKNKRILKGLTQKQLAELAGLNVVTIQSYEAGKYKPKQENMSKICKILDMPNEYNVFSSLQYELPTKMKETNEIPLLFPFYNLSIELEKLGFKLTIKEKDSLDYYILKSKNTTITVSKEELYLFNNDLQEMRKNDINFLIKQLFDKHKNNND